MTVILCTPDDALEVRITMSIEKIVNTTEGHPISLFQHLRHLVPLP